MNCIYRHGIVLSLVLLSGATSTLKAQDSEPLCRTTQYPHRYRLVDVGTFGGPDSIIPFVQSVLNGRGTVVGISETGLDDPNAPNCASPICKVQRGFEWRDGALRRLPALARLGESAAQSLNDWGVIVGDSGNGITDPRSGLPEIKAAAWIDGRLYDLGTLGGRSSGATAISNGNQITGWSETDPGSLDATETHAFLWEHGSLKDLGTLGGDFSFGQDVNNRGQVIEFSSTNSVDPGTGQPAQHPFFWQNGKMIDLSLGGSAGGSDFLNQRGDAIGDSTLPGDAEDHAFLWSRGKLRDLGTLGGTFSRPTGLTEEGHVSGVASTADDQLLHAVLWRDNHTVDLGTIPGDACSFAWGLNSSDQVVGISLPSCDFSVARAFFWEKGAMLDLNSLVDDNPTGLHLVYAESINDSNEIVGIGVPPGISPADVETLGHAFVLIPNGRQQFIPQSDGTSSVEEAAPIDSARAKQATSEMIQHVRKIQARRYLYSQR
jgi:probable HAF family extracellular repeat protein